MNREQVEQRVKVALDVLYYNDSFLLKNNSSEWSVAHKLAEYVQRMFPRYHVDFEYNREPGDEVTKTLSGLSECHSNSNKPGEERNIRPDILIHERGHNQKNLVVFEVKLDVSETKEFNLSENAPCDHAKLRELTSEEHEFEYDYGLFVDFPIEADVFYREVRMQWYPEEDPFSYLPLDR